MTVAWDRDPAAAIVSEWHRARSLKLYGRQNMHTSRVPVEEFRNENFYKWARQKAVTWAKQMNHTCGDPAQRILLQAPPRMVRR